MKGYKEDLIYRNKWNLQINKLINHINIFNIINENYINIIKTLHNAIFSILLHDIIFYYLFSHSSESRVISSSSLGLLSILSF